MAQDAKTSGIEKAVVPEEQDSEESSDDGLDDNEVDTGLPEADVDDESEDEEDADVGSANTDLLF